MSWLIDYIWGKGGNWLSLLTIAFLTHFLSLYWKAPDEQPVSVMGVLVFTCCQYQAEACKHIMLFQAVWVIYDALNLPLRTFTAATSIQQCRFTTTARTPPFQPGLFSRSDLCTHLSYKNAYICLLTVTQIPMWLEIQLRRQRHRFSSSCISTFI